MESLRKVMGKLREELKKKDRDGNINEHELMRVLQACGYEVPEEDMAKIMKDADKSGDGQINHDEFVKFWVHKVELDALENIAEQMRHDFKASAHISLRDFPLKGGPFTLRDCHMRSDV